MRIFAFIIQPSVIDQILAHLRAEPRLPCGRPGHFVFGDAPTHHKLLWNSLPSTLSIACEMHQVIAR
jgi:hypothetical protein